MSATASRLPAHLPAHLPEDPEGWTRAALERGDLGAALDGLMEAYGTAVYRFCRQMVVEEDLAQEAHQMTFVQAFESLPTFAGRSSLRSWLFSIARHRCLDALKSLRRRRWRFGSLDEAVGDDRPHLPHPLNPEATVEEALAERARRRALSGCLRRLAPRVRAALLLRYQQELSYPEIAQLAAEKAPALQMRVARALPVLRRCLEERGMAQ